MICLKPFLQGFRKEDFAASSDFICPLKMRIIFEMQVFFFHDAKTKDRDDHQGNEKRKLIVNERKEHSIQL
jgi:hypothetical protein